MLLLEDHTPKTKRSLETKPILAKHIYKYNICWYTGKVATFAPKYIILPVSHERSCARFNPASPATVTLKRSSIRGPCCCNRRTKMGGSTKCGRRCRNCKRCCHRDLGCLRWALMTRQGGGALLSMQLPTYPFSYKKIVSASA